MENTEKNSKKSNAKKIVILVIVVLLAAAMGAAGWGFSYYKQYAGAGKAFPGVKINGEDISGLTEEEAQAKLDESVGKVLDQKLTVNFRKEKKEIPFSKLGVKADTETAMKEAYSVIHDKNVAKVFYEMIKLSYQGSDVPLHYEIDQDVAAKAIKKNLKGYEAKKKDASITRKDGKFKITPEVDGVKMDFDACLKSFTDIVGAEDWDQKAATIDATFELDKAEHTKKELSQIKDVLGKFTTTYYTSAWGRRQNLANGASHINGTVLYPGDTFSVYGAVAPFNKANGYELAGSYLNGKTIQTYGGGICQVSTTLYNAVLRAELEIVQRQCHSMTVHYVELSEDAAISGTEKDMKFKNNLDAPIYIEGHGSDGVLTFTVYGKETRPKNRSIEFVSETLSVRPSTEKIVKDKTMPKGKRKIEEKGSTGYKAKLWKNVYVDGKRTDHILINTSEYMATKTIVRVGTKEVKKKDETETGKDGKTKKTATTEKKTN